MILRLVSTVAAATLLVGCSAEEGLRAQELLQQAEAAQRQLRSSTFDGAMRISVDGMDVQMLFVGATSSDDLWFSLQTRGVPNGGDMTMQILVRDGRSWLNMGSGWESAGAAGATTGAPSADAFQQLARYVKDVRVTEHQPIGGKLVTTIAGEIDTQGMLEAFANLSSLAPSGSFGLSDAGIDVGDIRALLTIDEGTHLLDTALISFGMAAQGKNAEVELRYRLASVNEPVELPRP